MTTPDIHLRELELRVVHRGAPWLEREDLMRSGERIRRLILADLERLLGQALAGYAPDAALGEIDLALELGAGGAQVRLRPNPVPGGVTSTPAATAPPPDRRSAGGSATGGPLVPSPPHAISAPAARPNMPDGAPRGAAALLAILLAWHAEASLARRLALLPEALLVHWRRLLCAALTRSHRPEAAHETPTRAPAATALARGADRSPQRTPAGFPSALAALIALVSLVARHAPRHPPVDEIAALAAAPVTDSPAPAPASRAIDAKPSSATPVSRVSARPAPEAPDHPRAAPETVAAAAPLPVLLSARPAIARVENALPLLMLGPLDRIGWLAAAGAALAAADLGEAAAVLGFALALKALPPPARGWRHEPAQLQAAALAAGLAEPVPGARIAALERALGGHLALADAVIADALLRGREAGAPLAVVAGEGWLALVEPEGLFPLALGTCWDEIAAVALAAAAPLVCGPQAAAPDLLQAIDSAGLTFAAHGAPGRDEAWRPLVGRAGWRGMTNAEPALHRRLAGAATWAEDEGRALTMLAAFGKDRPLAAAGASGALDRSLTLAATVALGDIAWRLHGADPAAWARPEAGLAFARFADLAAHVDIGAERIEVLLPLGRRARDLAAAGLCADVTAVPWLGGRRLRFAIG
jgi:hypothetical protein